MADHDYFYFSEEWEITFPDDMEAEAFCDCDNGVYRMGRLQALPDKYAAVVWRDGAQDVHWFDSEGDAQAFLDGVPDDED